MRHSGEDTKSQGNTNQAYDDASHELMQQIEEPLLHEHAQFQITTMCTQYRALFSAKGVKNKYRSSKLVKWIIFHFTLNGKCKVSVINQKGTSSLLYSSNLQVIYLLCEIERLKECGDVNEESSEEMEVSLNLTLGSFHTAKELRRELKQQRKGHNSSLKQLKCQDQKNLPDDQILSTSTDPPEEPPQALATMNISYESAYQRVLAHLYNHIA